MAERLCLLCERPLPPARLGWLGQVLGLRQPPVHDPVKYPECHRRFRTKLGLPPEGHYR